MEDIPQAITQSENDLRDMRLRLAEAKELVDSLEQEVSRIEIELVGLRSYAERRGLTPEQNTAPALAFADASRHGDVVPISADVAFAPAATRPTLAEDMTLMSRNDAVALVMTRLGGPTGRNMIHEHCVMAGRDDTIDDISLSLTSLKRAGRVVKLGRGLWRLAEPTPATG